ncbi:MAG: acyl-CoA dehydrogenase family protein [Parasphingopyxis sp.]|uniref:acyl-CoA dehydrogenase family protein n=1 Tax=Parasphingopyxis sp. TaxID=1920299 RepID=UPI0032EF98C1
MDLTPNDEQEALRFATIAWLEGNMPLAEARNRAPTLWSGMKEMGWLEMTRPEMGLDHATEALIFAELGRFLAPVAALSTAVAARWTGLLDTVAVALRGHVLDPVGTTSALGLFDGKAGLIEFAAESATPGLDLSTLQVRLDEMPSPSLIDEPLAALHFRLLAAAYGVGCAEAAGDMATEYAKVREQFGKPIGSFQAIKHICADMAVRSQVARSQLYYAACALDAGDADTAFYVAAAKRLADQAALENGRANIQVHGGIGMTDEAQPHLPLKRAHLLQFVAPVETADLL